MEKVVLGLEPATEGKFIVVTGTNHQFFAGFDKNGVGGHTDIYCLLENFDSPHMARRCSQHLKTFAQRPILIDAFEKVSKFPLELQVLDRQIKGGLYTFDDSNLRLHDSSTNYGAAEEQVLRDFEAPIREYCSQKGFKLDKLLIG